MKMNIATVSYSGNLEKTLESVAKAGYSGVELLFDDLDRYNGRAKSIGKLCRDLGLNVVALQPLRSYEGALNWQKKMDSAKYAFELMAEVQTDLTVLCSNTHADLEFEPSRWVDQLNELAESARDAEVRIGYEALAWGTFVNRFEAAWSLVRKVDHPSFGIVLDSFHTFSISNEIENLDLINPSKIFLVQLADANRMGLDLISWSRKHRKFPGYGQFRIPEFVARLQNIGYDGPYSFEVFSEELRAMPIETVSTEGFAFRLIQAL